MNSEQLCNENGYIKEPYRKKVKCFYNKVISFLKKEDGMGVVEVILIVVVLVGLVLIFKDKMTTIVSGMFSSITDGINKVTT